jgi:ADP-heptose:LPS heptosyltransferase
MLNKIYLHIRCHEKLLLLINFRNRYLGHGAVISEQESQLSALGVKRYPGAITSFADTAALIMHMDVVISVDTAISHLSGALGRPTWVMLNQYGQDWRWLLDRNNSPWYSTATLFRQPTRGDWASVTKKISQYLSWYKV